MHRLIVIGASVGGVRALERLAASLPADLPAAVLVVLHVGTHPSVLPDLLSRSGKLPARHAAHNEVIRPGHIYVAPPDHHLLVVRDAIELTRGPKEHHSRPAVDPLFLSAALSRGPAVIGVVLTGMLDDGTAGLKAVKMCGGVAIVQDPDDALAPNMPRSALRHVDVDHCEPLEAIAPLLATLAAQPVPATEHTVPQQLVHELALTYNEGNPVNHLNAIGTPSPFVCPECHGNLWALRAGKPERYRCHTGHAYTLGSLQHFMSKAADEAMWNALRALQEREQLLQHVAAVYRAAGTRRDAELAAAMADSVKAQARVIRGLVEASPEPLE